MYDTHLAVVWSLAALCVLLSHWNQNRLRSIGPHHWYRIQQQIETLSNRQLNTNTHIQMYVCFCSRHDELYDLSHTCSAGWGRIPHTHITKKSLAVCSDLWKYDMIAESLMNVRVPVQLNLKSRRRHASCLSDRERDILSPLTHERQTVSGGFCINYINYSCWEA